VEGAGLPQEMSATTAANWVIGKYRELV